MNPLDGTGGGERATHPTVAVGLIDASLDQVADGFALAAFLDMRAERCVIKNLGRLSRRGSAAQALGETGARLVCLAAGSANLSEVLGVARLLTDPLVVVLFGRQLSDPHLRREVPPGVVTGVIVGDPFLTALEVARRLPCSGRSRDATEPKIDVAGLIGPGGRGRPREPQGELDALPPADYTGQEQLVALAVPLRCSRGGPHPCSFSAERVWEMPVRRWSVERSLEELAHQVQSVGARHFIFTDQVVNTSTEDLLQLARGIVDRELRIRWHGRVWPDPLLDRAAVHLLRRSGCRNLEVELYSCSNPLSRRMETGVETEAATSLVRSCRAEGIQARVRLLVGLPTESEEDRTATLCWLARCAQDLFEVSELSTAVIREGAPLWQQLHFPEDGDPAKWHDGGVNNASKRYTWRREMEAWIDHMGIWRRSSAQGPAFNDELGRRVVGRLAGRVARTLADDPDWRRENLMIAGVLSGKEAYCGPRQVWLDLVGMEATAAIRVLEEFARIGTRSVVLGPAHLAGEDVLSHPGLERVLSRACELGLERSISSPLSQVEAERLRRVARMVQSFRLEARDDGCWTELARWVPVIAAMRAEEGRGLPRVMLTASIVRGGRGIRAVIEAAASWGVERLALDLDRSETGMLAKPQRGVVRDDLICLAGLRPLIEGSDQSNGDTFLLPTGSGWPDGFKLESDDRGARCTCPAGLGSRRIDRHNSDPSARYARFDPEACRHCHLLSGCPVDRVGFHLRLPLVSVEGTSQLASDLEDPDCGLGRLSRAVDHIPCLVGWDTARIDRRGELYLCPESGVEPLGNVLEADLADLWYGPEANEFRYLGQIGARVRPTVDRMVCRQRCRLLPTYGRLLRRIHRLSREQRETLEQVGEAERLR